MYFNTTNLKRIHYFEDVCYIFGEDGVVLQLNEVQTFLLSKIINEPKTISDISKDVDKELGINDFIKTSQIINDIILDLHPVINLSSESQIVARNTFKFSGKKNERFPYSINLFLTNKCLNSCLHCFRCSSVNGLELDYSLLSDFLKYVQNKTPCIVLTGGEPLLYSNLDKLFDQFGSDFKISLMTSGFSEELLENKYISKLDSINFTLYGVTEKEHNTFVNNQNSFYYSMKNLQKFQDYGKEITAIYQAKSNKLEELEKMIQHCISLNIKKILIGEIFKMGRAEKLLIWEGSYDSSSIQSNIAFLNIKYKDDIVVIYDDEHSIHENSKYFFRCGGGVFQWNIFENGRISPCGLINNDFFEIGNLKLRNFKDIILGKKYYEYLEGKWKVDYLKNNGINKNYNICENIGIYK